MNEDALLNFYSKQSDKYETSKYELYWINLCEIYSYQYLTETIRIFISQKETHWT